MKKMILVFAAIVFCSCLLAQEKLPGSQVVQQTVIGFFDALSNRDSIALSAFSSPDIRLFEYGSVWTLDSLIRRAIRENRVADFARTNQFDFINTEISGQSAWTSYTLKSAFTVNGRKSIVEWMETIILVRVQGNWKIKVLHSSLVRRS